MSTPRLQNAALAVGAAGLVLCGAGALFSPAHFFRAYLVAFTFWAGVALGCLFLLMVQHLTGGAWGLLLRRILEAGAQTLLLLAVLGVPLLFVLPWLYPWADAAHVAHDADLQHKQAYLNVPFFVLRYGVYFAAWLLLVALLTWWSREQDERALPGAERRFRLLSAPGLGLYGLTVTFASIDWGMSLEPHWFSTMYPVLYAAGQTLSGMAFAVVVLLLLAPLSEVVKPSHRRDLGNLLLMFVMVWAYLSFSQFLLIWAENLPEETPYYLRRMRGGWQWVALMLVLCQFALPFLFLLFREVKEDPRWLAGLAGFVLVMRFVDIVWWVEAAFAETPSFWLLLDGAAVLGMGGLWFWFFQWRLAKSPPLPLHDPYLAEYLPEVVAHE